MIGVGSNIDYSAVVAGAVVVDVASVESGMMEWVICILILVTFGAVAVAAAVVVGDTRPVDPVVVVVVVVALVVEVLVADTAAVAAVVDAIVVVARVGVVDSSVIEEVAYLHTALAAAAVGVEVHRTVVVADDVAVVADAGAKVP